MSKILLPNFFQCYINNEEVPCRELFSDYAGLFIILGFILSISVYILLFFLSRRFFKKYGFEEQFNHITKIEGITVLVNLLFFSLIYYFILSNRFSIAILFFTLAFLTILGSFVYVILYFKKVLKETKPDQENLITKYLKFFYGRFFIVPVIILVTVIISFAYLIILVLLEL